MLNRLLSLGIKTKLIGSFLILAILAGVTGFVGYSGMNRVGEEGVTVGVKLAPLGDAAMEVKLTAANAHLLFEEIMAGDESEDINEVWQLLNETLFYCNAILSGGENDEGTFFASENPAVLEKMQQVKKSVENFIESARKRYESRTSAAGTGSEADQNFDSSYESIMSDLDKILSTYQSDADYMDVIVAAGRAKFSLADSHLFFEELLSGDDSIDMADVLDGMTSAKKEVEFISTKVEASAVSSILGDIDQFIAAAKTRHANNLNESTAGSEVDEAFDQEYESFIALADEAEEIIHDSMDHGMAELKAHIQSAGKALLAVLFVTLLFAVIIGFILSKTIVNAFDKCLGLASAISGGNLTSTIELDQLPNDETGVLGKELNTMSSNLKTMLGKIQSGVERLQLSTTNLSKASEQIENNSEQTTEKSIAVAAASDEMNDNMNSVASSTEQITSNIQMVSSAAEEMISTIQEISTNTMKGNEITQNAVDHTHHVSQKVKELDKAAQEINKVTETISDISAQTNLLALNATIEAARAGEAGKGFAVVASEIKALALQTAEATDEINNKISSVQGNISESVGAIEKIVNIIGDINEIVTTVATAVEEQSVTSQEISKNINEAAHGVHEVNDNMNQITAATAEVAQDVTLVNEAASQTTTDCVQIKNSSQDLEDLSTELKEMVSTFKI